MKKLLYAIWIAALAFLGAPCSAEPAEEVLNRLAGAPLSGRSELWGEPPSAVIRRMNINCLADRMGKEQMFATRFSRTLFGCPAVEIRLFAVEGKLAKIDIFFLNKGDSVGKKRSSGDFRKMLHSCHHDLEKLLTSELGGSERVNFAGAAKKHQLPAWKLDRYVLVVDYAPQEYLMLHIVPPEALGRRGKSSGAALPSRQSYAEHVKRNDRGDVFIADVPMVDQGGKGYCVPATVERLARYYGVSGVDMHKLAEQANTKNSGGTYIRGMLRSIHRLLSSCGLEVRSVGKLKKSTIMRLVDRGTPLLWVHYSTPEFGQRMRHSNAARGRATPEAWRKELRRQRLIKKSTKGAHIALIIGYNRDTGEIAITNSWGETHRLEWVRFADMEQVDQGDDLFVVEPRK